MQVDVQCHQWASGDDKFQLRCFTTTTTGTCHHSVHTWGLHPSPIPKYTNYHLFYSKFSSSCYRHLLTTQLFTERGHPFLSIGSLKLNGKHWKLTDFSNLINLWYFGGVSGQLGTTWRHLGGVLERLRRVLEAPWEHLGESEKHLGRLSVVF